MRNRRLIVVAFLLVCGLSLSAQSAGLVAQVKTLAQAKNVQEARKVIEQQRAAQIQLTSEWLAAVSWLARGASFAEQWDVAEQYAEEAYQGSLKLLQKRPLDADANADLPTALGASIEVLGQVYNARGERATAVAFLRQQHEKYRGTSIEARLQKNLLSLTLQGKPFPGLENEHYLGRQPTANDTNGKVTLYFFWAHWCADCKRQLPILEELHRDYGDRGLVIVGPTRLYGYVAGGATATPTRELDYLRHAYQQQHPIPSWMSAPVSTENFLRFGVSTTPTLILVDGAGMVRLYHPGVLSYRELLSHIEPLLD